MAFLSTKTKSDLRESPVIKDGDGNVNKIYIGIFCPKVCKKRIVFSGFQREEGRSAYNEAYITDDIDLARYKRTEL